MFKEDEGPWYHEMQSLGFNYRLSDVHAALGLSQLRKHKMFVERRTEIASKYDSALRGFSGIRLPSLAEDRTSAWHLYVIRVLDGKTARKKLFAKLQELGLGVQVHYIPVYWHPYYRNLGFKKGICPKAEKFYEQAISLPIYPSLSDKDFDEILTRTRDALRAIS
jgi:dTDP-4-amino-4,6-dideoxygalactose transaminase